MVGIRMFCFSLLLLNLNVALGQSEKDDLFNTVDSLISANNTDSVIVLLDSKVALLKSDTLNNTYARCLMSYGYVSYMRRHYDASVDYYIRAVEIETNASGETETLAKAHLALGNIYSAIVGTGEKQIYHFQESNRVYSKFEMYGEVAKNYANIGSCFAYGIDKQPPIFFNELAFYYLEKNKESLLFDKAMIERKMAIAYFTVDGDSSEYYYTKAYKTIQPSTLASDNYLKGLCAAGICESALENDNIDVVDQYINVAYDLFKKTRGENSYQTGSVHTLNGQLLLKKHAYDSAMVYANKALEVYQQYDESLNWNATCYILMSDIERARKNYVKANEYNQMAIYSNAIYSEYAGNVDAILPSDSSLYSDVQHRKNVLRKAELYHDIYIETGEVESLDMSFRVLMSYFNFILVGYYDKSFVLNGIDNNFSEYINEGMDYALEIAFSLYEKTGNSNYIEDSYNYLSLLKAGLFFNNNENNKNFNNPEVQDLYNRKNELSKQLEDMHFKKRYGNLTKDTLEVLYGQMEAAYVESFTINNEILRAQPNEGIDRQSSHFNVETLHRYLKTDELLLDYYYNDSSLFVFKVEANKIELKKVVLEDDLNKLIKNCYRDIKTGGTANSKNVLSLSRLLLVDSDEELLNTNKLAIIPFGNLSAFPFDILRLNDKYLLEETAIVKHFSAAILVSKKQKNQENQYHLVAYSPTFSSGIEVPENTRALLNTDTSFRDLNFLVDNSNTIAPLPYAAKEVEQIGKLCKKNNYSFDIIEGENATKNSFIHNASKSDIVHIASHGFASSDYPQLSGIFFYNYADDLNLGYLFLGDLPEINFMTDLIVLSACQSAIGTVHDYGGSISLPSSFVNSGVPNVIASLWKVHDEKTKDLMVAFYKHLLEDKVSYAEALRLAKLECIDKGFLPIDWAGFVLIGN